MANRTKIEVGQSWKKIHGSGLPYLITRVGNDSYGSLSAFWESDGKERRFALLNDEHYVHNWDDDNYNEWIVTLPSIANVVQAPIIPMVQQKSLFDFFKAVPAGHCPCGILRENCNFH